MSGGTDEDGGCVESGDCCWDSCGNGFDGFDGYLFGDGYSGGQGQKTSKDDKCL